jgi:hypothetical protein
MQDASWKTQDGNQKSEMRAMYHVTRMLKFVKFPVVIYNVPIAVSKMAEK